MRELAKHTVDAQERACQENGCEDIRCVGGLDEPTKRPSQGGGRGGPDGESDGRHDTAPTRVMTRTTRRRRSRPYPDHGPPTPVRTPARRPGRNPSRPDMAPGHRGHLRRRGTVRELFVDPQEFESTLRSSSRSSGVRGGGRPRPSGRTRARAARRHGGCPAGRGGTDGPDGGPPRGQRGSPSPSRHTRPAARFRAFRTGRLAQCHGAAGPGSGRIVRRPRRPPAVRPTRRAPPGAGWPARWSRSASCG